MWRKGVLVVFIIVLFSLLNARPVFSVNIDNCSVMDTQGETYNLTQDIPNSANSTCMDIAADDVILDCNGYEIDGVDGGSSYGVRIVNYDNVTIRNCEISDWAYGIDMSGSTDSRIYNNFITSNDRGMNVVSSSNNNNFTNNTVFFNTNYGVAIVSSSNNNFSYGNVSNNTNHGFYLSSADGNRIEYAAVGFNEQDGFNLDTSDGNVIYENNITSNKARGFYAASSSGNRIEGGNVKSNGNTGIRLYESTDNNVSGVNSSLNTNDGIYLESSSNGNRVENVIISDNTGNGIYVGSSSSSVITGFESYSNYNGLIMSYGSGNNLTGGSIHSNDNYGVSMSYSNNNYIVDTSVSASGDYEVYATDTGSSQNYFINTTFDKSDVSIGGSTTIWVRWYLYVQVRNTDENPLGGAGVNITDTYESSWFSNQTNSSGYIPKQTLSEYNQTSVGKNYYTNYTVNASMKGYHKNSTEVNLTGSLFFTVYLSTIPPPAVEVKTYDLGLSETTLFKPDMIVRVRAQVTSWSGRGYLENATIDITDNTKSLVKDNELMVNISEITNGYLYEYNYTLPPDASGLWTINVTAVDEGFREGFDTIKIAVSLLSLQVKLVLNSTSDSIYIPGTGERTFSGLTTSKYLTPQHYYIASYSGDALKSVVFSWMNPVSIFTEKGSNTYGIGTNQRFPNSMVFLVFSRGNWRQINNRIGMVKRGEFLSQISPSFSYGMGDKYPLKIVLSYNNIDINDTLSVGRGYSRVSIENKGAVGNKINLGVERI